MRLLTLSLVCVAALANSALATPKVGTPNAQNMAKGGQTEQSLTQIQALYQSTLLVNGLTATKCHPGAVVFNLPGLNQSFCAKPNPEFSAGYYTVQPDTMELQAISASNPAPGKKSAGLNP
jgi:hypothetical protein